MSQKRKRKIWNNNLFKYLVLILVFLKYLLHWTIRWIIEEIVDNSILYTIADSQNDLWLISNYEFRQEQSAYKKITQDFIFKFLIHKRTSLIVFGLKYM